MIPTFHLSRAARETPDRTAIYLGAAPWASWRELAGRSAALAGAFRGGLGLAAGDRVAVVMRNACEYLEALYAIWWAGLAAVPVNAKLHPDEVAFILKDSGARLVVADREWLPGLESAVAGLDRAPAVLEAGSAEWRRLATGEPLRPADPLPSSLAWLFYTSGTTGRPKGAMLTHGNLEAMTRAYVASVDEVPGNGRLLHAAPMSHGSGLYTFTHLARGAAQVLPESGAFDAVEVLALLEAHREVTLFAAPTMVKRLVQAAASSGARAPGLRLLVYGGGPMYLADALGAMEILGERLAQIYGQGESPMTITVLSRPRHADRSHPRYLERLASVGVAHAGIEIAIQDDEERTLPAGQTGEIRVRGATVMAGYWNNPDATARALQGGWLRTGDLGEFDADGFLTLKDRSKDLIISGGSNIYPREVEEVLLEHPNVLEAAVVGRPDPQWGEAVVAFIVARGVRPDPEELDRLCLRRIARFKRPKEYRFLETLPKNNYGKVLKTELRRLVASDAVGLPQVNRAPGPDR